MSVRKIFASGLEYDVTGIGYSGQGSVLLEGRAVDPNNGSAIGELISCGTLCNDSVIEDLGTGPDFRVVGSPTEVSLLVMASKAQVFREDLEKKHRRIAEIPFNSERKCMTTFHDGGNATIVYSKGATSHLLPKCSHYLGKNGVSPLTQNDIGIILEKNSELAERGFRVIAFASKEIAGGKANNLLEEEKGLVFLGMVAMEDPPRETVMESLKACETAGIKVVIATGDDPLTARSIAREIGLWKKGSEIITGDELEKLTDEELADKIGGISIFARVKPLDKLRIISAYKKNGEIIAMTGDGVNDAPALEEAHIGVAMGKKGTDVSRQAADIILKDDNFSTIVEAIREGRIIYSNIQKFITYQLSCNFAELTVIILGTVLFGPAMVPLVALQILFMNLVTDDFPAIMLSFDRTQRNVMKEKPKTHNQSLLQPKHIFLILTMGAVMGIGTLLGFHIYSSDPIEKARSFALATLIAYELFNAINFRSLS